MQHTLILMLVSQVSPQDMFHGSIRDMIFHAGPLAKIVLLFLLFFSVLSWAIIIDKQRTFRRLQVDDEKFLNLFRNSRGGFELIYRHSQQLANSPLAQVFRAGYRQLLAERERESDQSDEKAVEVSAKEPTAGERERLQVVLEQTGREEVNNLEHMLTFLATTGSVSPFIGLFGTVWGIMNSFRGLGMQGSASIGAVAPGIAEALIATAAGLVAAIPAVIAYNHFLHKLTIQTERMADFNREFIGRIIP